MDIVERIKLFLSQNKLASSTFADTCGIPRPSLSQLLNGRNRKVSNEVLDKIHQAYPEINMLWLMFGDGEMFVPNANFGEESSSAQLHENTFPGNAHPVQDTNHSHQTLINFGETDANDYSQTNVHRQPAARQTTQPSFETAIAAMAARQTTAKSPRSSSPEGARRIISVVVVYSDGTTEAFTP